jgi:hypothetical protein
MRGKKHKDCIVCSIRKVKGAIQKTYLYFNTGINQPAMCPGECFERYHALKNFKSFSAGPIFYMVFVVYTEE